MPVAIAFLGNSDDLDFGVQPVGQLLHHGWSQRHRTAQIIAAAPKQQRHHWRQVTIAATANAIAKMSPESRVHFCIQPFKLHLSSWINQQCNRLFAVNLSLFKLLPDTGWRLDWEGICLQEIRLHEICLHEICLHIG
jgi:hypothetical protein